MKAGIVPSRLAWSVDSPEKRKPPKSLSVLSKAKNTSTELIVSQTAETCNSPQLAECVPEVKNDTQTQHAESDKECLLQMEKLKQENVALKTEIERLKRRNSFIDSQVFQLQKFTSDENMAFYAGFPNVSTFKAVFDFVNRGDKGENIKYWSSKDKSVEKDFYETSGETEEPTSKSWWKENLRTYQRVLSCTL